MAEVTKADIEKLYEKLDDVKASQNTMAVAMAEMKTRIEMMPPTPKRPCSHFEALQIRVDAHLRDAAETQRDWKRLLIDFIGEILKYGAIAAIGILIGSKI